jgi:hypothetical protein
LPTPVLLNSNLCQNLSQTIPPPLRKALRNRDWSNDLADSNEESGCLEVMMEISLRALRRQVSGCLLLALVAPVIAVAASPQQSTKSDLNVEGTSSSSAQTQSNSIERKIPGPAQTESLPDSPGSVQTIAQNQGQNGQPSQPQQPNSTQQPSITQEPVGTAASQSVKATGVAASQPAGAAIAPAKQRRTRSILIKVGALVGAGVAVGTIVGLTAASPGRPR